MIFRTASFAAIFALLTSTHGRVSPFCVKGGTDSELSWRKERATRKSKFLSAALSYVHRGLGDLETGLEWWARGIEERDLLIVQSLTNEPGYDPLRFHPACQALLRKMNLEP